MILYRQLGAYVILLGFAFSLTAFFYFQTQSERIAFAKGQRAFKKGDHATAIPYYQQAISEGIVARKAYLHLGDALSAEQRFPEAVELYKGYLAKYPLDHEIRLRYARVLSYMGNFEESAKEYKQVQKELKNADEHPSAHK